MFTSQTYGKTVVRKTSKCQRGITVIRLTSFRPKQKSFLKNFTSTFTDYGEKENADIAEKYGVKKDDFPVYKLFVEGKDEPVTYQGNTKSSDDIVKFLIRESGKIT